MSQGRVYDIERSKGYIWDVGTLSWIPAQQGSGGGGGGGAVTVADGADVAQGATTDAAVVSDASGTVSSKLRGLVKILANVWDNVAGTLHVSLYDHTGTELGTSGNPLIIDTAFALNVSNFGPLAVDLLNGITSNTTGSGQGIPSGGGTGIINVHAVSASGGTTVAWEASGDGSNFFPLLARQLGANPPVYATSIANPTTWTQWEVNTAGLLEIRANVTNYSAGTITVSLQSTAGSPPSWVSVTDRKLIAVSGSASSSGNNTVVTPTSGTKLRVYYLAYNPSSANECAFRFGASGALFLRNNLTQGGSVVAKDYGDFRYLEGAVNEALVLNLTNSVATIWNVNYIEV